MSKWYQQRRIDKHILKCLGSLGPRQGKRKVKEPSQLLVSHQGDFPSIEFDTRHIIFPAVALPLGTKTNDNQRQPNNNRNH